MRRRIALQKHFVRSLARMLSSLCGRFGCGLAFVRRFPGWFQHRGAATVRLSFIIATAVCLTSCASLSQHQFPEPAGGWQTRSGQLMYRAANTTLIGEAIVRFSNTGDFELIISKGPGITLLSLRQDAAFAEVNASFTGQHWSGPVAQAPQQLRGWLALRDQFLRTPNQKTLRYVSGDETFLFRF
jgi:hypothetical protein